MTRKYCWLLEIKLNLLREKYKLTNMLCYHSLEYLICLSNLIVVQRSNYVIKKLANRFTQIFLLFNFFFFFFIRNLKFIRSILSIFG